MFASNWLSALNDRLRSRSSARLRRDRGKRRRQFAAKVSPMEQRCLMSSNGLGGGLHSHKVAQDQPGAPVIRKFAGYEWNANYRWSQDSGEYSDGQLWSPNNAQVKGGKLELTLQPTTLSNNSPSTISADVDLVAKADGAPFHPGYGTYLVAAETAGSFNRLADNNGAIFGAFTYENLHAVGKFGPGNTITGLPPSLVALLKPGFVVTAVNYKGQPLVPIKDNPPGSQAITTITSISGNTVTIDQSPINNPGDYPHTIYFTDNTLKNAHRELDLIEALKDEPAGTNAQFTLQPWNALPGRVNVHRITSEDRGKITLVMHWDAADEPVTFDEYYGLYNLNDLPKKAANTWTTGNGKNEEPNQNPYIPNDGQQTFHLNLWWASWRGAPVPHAEEVTVTNFEYEPPKPPPN